MNEALLYVGSGLIFVWGVAHIVPTRPVVRGFGEISEENRRIITMEWIAEGLTLCFIGALVLLLTAFKGAQSAACIFVYRAAAVMLLIMAGLTAATGARTSIVAIKICPFVKTAVAVLFILGSAL